jgi:hypothetical protein
MSNAAASNPTVKDKISPRTEWSRAAPMGAKVGTPIVRATGARKGMSLISAVISRGDMRFMIIGKGSVYADVFIEFLKRLIRGAGRKIFLIVDRGPAHRAKKAGAFVQTLVRKLRLFLSCLSGWLAFH